MELKLQELQEYKELTDAETKILEFRMTNVGKLNITEMCEKIGISRETYYNALVKPAYIRCLMEATDLYKAKMHYPEVVDSIVGKALDGNFKHQELYLEKWGGGRKDMNALPPLIIMMSNGKKVELDKINAIPGEVIDPLKESKELLEKNDNQGKQPSKRTRKPKNIETPAVSGGDTELKQ